MCLASLLDTASSALGPAFMPGGSGSPAPIVQLALARFSMSGLIRSPRMLRASKRRPVRFDPLEARPQAVRDAAIRQSLDSSRPSPLPSPGSTVNWRLNLLLFPFIRPLQPTQPPVAVAPRGDRRMLQPKHTNLSRLPVQRIVKTDWSADDADFADGPGSS